jgi:hypothetical protein
MDFFSTLFLSFLSFKAALQRLEEVLNALWVGKEGAGGWSDKIG